MECFKHQASTDSLITLRFLSMLPLVLGSCLLGFMACNAEEVRPLIPRSDILTKASVDHLRLSPDGSQFSYIKIDGDNLSAWVASSDAPSNITPIGESLPGKTHDCRWSANGKNVILWQEVERGVAHLIRVDLDSGNHLDLTPFPNSICRFAGLSTETPNDILYTTNYRDPSVNELWRVNVESGERTKVQGLTGFVNVHVDGNFVPCVAEKLKGSKGNYEIDLLSLDSDGNWRGFCTLNYDDLGFHEGSEPVLGMNADGSTCYIVDRSDRDKSALYEVSTLTGEKKLVVEDADSDIAMNTFSETFSFTNSYTNELVAVSAFFDRERKYALSAENQAHFDFLAKHFGSPVGVSCTSADGATWIVYPLDGGPRRFHFYDSVKEEISYLVSQYAELDDYRLPKRSVYVVSTRDGLQLPCHLYLPPDADKNEDGKPDFPLPMMMWVHGGPNIFYSWDDWLTNRHLQLLADRGYASLRVEFRGTDGLGRNVRRKGYKQWGEEAQADLNDVAKWAIAEGIANEGEVGIWGWSYGGYATNAAATISQPEFRCGISMYGVSSLEALLKQSGEKDDTEWWRNVLGDERTTQGRASLRRRSPLLHVAKANMPLLITCGGRDVLVPHDVQSEPFARRLLELGKPVTYVYYPDEPHDYRQDKNWRSFWAIGERFLSHHLGGRFEPFNGDLKSCSIEIKFGTDEIPGLVEAMKQDGTTHSPG